MENSILIKQEEDNDFEIHMVSEEGSVMVYKCRGYDSTIETAKLFRRDKHPEVPIYKQVLGDETPIKIIG